MIGTGGAGLSAAATVLDEGKEVIMLEKFAAIGGNTIRTGGQVNAAEPKWQSAFLHSLVKRHIDTVIKS